MTDLNLSDIDVNKKESDGSHISQSLRELENPEVEDIFSKKTVSFIFAFCLTYGNIIGSGIFISVSETMNTFDSNSIGMTVIFWIIGGIISLTGGLCYAELGTRIPESGGERAYYREILDEKISRTFVIFYVFLLNTLNNAALAITTGKYFLSIFDEKWKEYIYLEKGIAVTSLLLFFIVNSISKVVANKFGVVLTVLKTVAILLIVFGGIWNFNKSYDIEWSAPFKMEGFSMSRLGICFVNIFYAYGGWNTLGLVAGDMKNPSRDLPRGIFFGLFVVMVMYVFTIISYVSIIGYDAAKKSETIAEQAAKIFLHQAYPIIPILICCSAAGSANGNLFAISSVASSAGYKGEILKIFSLVRKEKRTPVFSLWVITLLSMGFCIFDFQVLINYCGFLAWIFYLISFICLWKIKKETQGHKIHDIFQVPFYCIVPMTIVSIFMIWMTFKEYRIGCSIFTILFFLILGVQYFSNVLLPQAITTAQDKLIVFLSKYGFELGRKQDFS